MDLCVCGRFHWPVGGGGCRSGPAPWASSSWPAVPDRISLWGLRLKICQRSGQWADVRPFHFLPGITSPLRKADDTELDWVVVRENNEGEYAGLGGCNLFGRGPGGEVAVSGLSGRSCG
ncbi:hypothetical protein ACH4F6_30260 [Streptomyces sp. NPDC017936]|uniref:hypothetical protein n=1 Tax=Streptomyces sp. NPDC017936 TaxID=3365016 RepID=UPI00379629DA